MNVGPSADFMKKFGAAKGTTKDKAKAIGNVKGKSSKLGKFLKKK